MVLPLFIISIPPFLAHTLYIFTAKHMRNKFGKCIKKNQGTICSHYELHLKLWPTIGEHCSRRNIMYKSLRVQLFLILHVCMHYEAFFVYHNKHIFHTLIRAIHLCSLYCIKSTKKINSNPLLFRVFVCLYIYTLDYLPHTYDRDGTYDGVRHTNRRNIYTWFQSYKQLY